MLYGLNENGDRIRAAPFVHAHCSICREELIPKCGEIRVWHFAHKSIEDCDCWHQNETGWHIEWKTFFPIEQQEVHLGQHRADVKINELVLEFQHSSISQSEIRERESFYGNLIWILDASEWEIDFCAIESIDRTRFYLEFWFNKSLQVWRRAEAPILLHCGGNEIIWTRSLNWSSGYGQGIYIQRDLLLERFQNGNFIPPLNNTYKFRFFPNSQVSI